MLRQIGLILTFISSCFAFGSSTNIDELKYSNPTMALKTIEKNLDFQPEDVPENFNLYKELVIINHALFNIEKSRKVLNFLKNAKPLLGENEKIQVDILLASQIYLEKGWKESLNLFNSLSDRINSHSSKVKYLYYYNRGQIESEIDLKQDAIKNLQHALIFAENKDQYYELTLLIADGIGQKNDISATINLYKQVHAYFKSKNYLYMSAVATSNFAYFLQRHGKYSEALEKYLESEKLAQDMGDVYGENLARLFATGIYINQNKFNLATKTLAKIDTKVFANDPISLAKLKKHQATLISQDSRSLNLAIDVVSEGLKSLKGTSHVITQGDLKEFRAELLFKAGRAVEAYQELKGTFDDYKLREEKEKSARLADQQAKMNFFIIERDKEILNERLKNKSLEQYIIVSLSLIIIAPLALALKRFLGKLKQSETKLSAETKVKTHTLNQLKKVFYPHQVREIEKGKTLEETLPIGKNKAVVISFDVVNSSKILEDVSKSFFRELFTKCHDRMLKGYDSHQLKADAFRIKELGDGFICSVGFPFEPINNDIFNTAIELCLDFYKIFRDVNDDFDIDLQCGIGAAYGEVEASFPESGTKNYDILGIGVVKAVRYESMRKQIGDLSQGISTFIIQESVFENILPQFKESFEEIDLETIGYKVRDDEQADRIFLHRFVDSFPLDSVS